VFVAFVQIVVDRFSTYSIADGNFISVCGYTWKLSCSVMIFHQCTCFAVELQFVIEEHCHLINC